MSGGAGALVGYARDDSTFTDMLLRVQQVDPGADAEALRRYAREIADAFAVLQTLDLDPTHTHLPAGFSPDWASEQTR